MLSMWSAHSDLDYYAEAEEPEIEVDNQSEPPEWAVADLPLPDEPGCFSPRRVGSALNQLPEVA
jgi:hypothetical protein